MSIPIAGNGTDARSVAAARACATRSSVRLRPVPDASADVTGMTAQSVDFNALLKSRAPLVFVFVLGLAFMLLLVVFR